MKKVDIKKDLKYLYNPSHQKVVAVDVPVMNFLKIDGQGDPNNSDEFISAVEALYPVAYSLKFMVKKIMAVDYGVMPLEGLWWAEDMNDFVKNNRAKWKWTLMIMQPHYITEELFQSAVLDVKAKKDPKALSGLRFENYIEGKSAQILHIGPYADEGPDIKKVHSFIKENGNSISGLHHEIYLSDMRRTAADKLKTILRQPYM